MFGRNIFKYFLKERELPISQGRIPTKSIPAVLEVFSEQTFYGNKNDAKLYENKNDAKLSGTENAVKLNINKHAAKLSHFF